MYMLIENSYQRQEHMEAHILLLALWYLYSRYLAHYNFH